MATSKRYETKDEKVNIVQMLSKRYGIAEYEIIELYEKEVDDLEHEARIKDFVSVLAARRVKHILSAGPARSFHG